MRVGKVRGQSQLAGLGKRDSAESKLAASFADDDTLDPASRSGGLDEQVQAVAVGVPSGRGGTDEGDRERLVGAASSAPGSAACGGESDYDGSVKTNSAFGAPGARPPPTGMARYCRPSTA